MKYTESTALFCPLFYMGAKLGLPHIGRTEVESALSGRVTGN